MVQTYRFDRQCAIDNVLERACRGEEGSTKIEARPHRISIYVRLKSLPRRTTPRNLATCMRRTLEACVGDNRRWRAPLSNRVLLLQSRETSSSTRILTLRPAATCSELPPAQQSTWSEASTARRVRLFDGANVPAWQLEGLLRPAPMGLNTVRCSLRLGTRKRGTCQTERRALRSLLPPGRAA